jgi:hypothetical protein
MEISYAPNNAENVSEERYIWTQEEGQVRT